MSPGRAALATALVAALVAAAPAHAADPGRWRLVRADAVPLRYFQGIAHSNAGSWFFDGVFQGVYRTDRHVRQKAATASVLTPDLLAQGFNHIGDLTWDAREGGRLLLPMECFTPGAPNGGNTCGRGAIGVADPSSLRMRYAVALDPADIPKAMWAEVAPGGDLMWTSSGRDLLAYRTADLYAGAPIPHPAARLPGRLRPAASPAPCSTTGASCSPGQDTGVMQVWSVDVATGARRLELELPGVRAESEGLDILKARGGVLHWLLSPFPPGGGTPT